MQLKTGQVEEPRRTGMGAGVGGGGVKHGPHFPPPAHILPYQISLTYISHEHEQRELKNKSQRIPTLNYFLLVKSCFSTKIETQGESLYHQIRLLLK